jgi:hypothetical protein
LYLSSGSSGLGGPSRVAQLADSKKLNNMKSLENAFIFLCPQMNANERK